MPKLLRKGMVVLRSGQPVRITYADRDDPILPYRVSEGLDELGCGMEYWVTDQHISLADWSFIGEET